MTDFEIIAEANHWFDADQAGWTNVLDFVKAIQPQLVAVPSEADGEWRRLALQFDGHRMQAIAHLRALMEDPVAHRPVVAAFLAAPPLPGEAVLAERIKALAATPADQEPQTDLQREIASDAEAFEATLAKKPARELSRVYPWGWRYVSNEIQAQFRDWCCRHPK